MVVLLALDTATGTSSVAVLDRDEVVAQSLLVDVNAGDVTVRQIDDLCSGAGIRRSQLREVAVGVGPGPYTSTRIGVSIARTIAFALGLTIHGVCSHDAIAAEFVARGAPGMSEGSGFVVATDARRREIYWALYDSTGSRLVGPDVAKPGQVVAELQEQRWVGDGLERYPDLVAEFGLAVESIPGPKAQWIGRIARAALADGQVLVSPTELVGHDSGESVAIPAQQRLFAPVPLYLRRPDAKLPAAGSK